MLKLLNVTRISHFCTLMADFSSNFKPINILSYLDELLSLQYMVRKLEMSSFHHNLNRIKSPPVALDMSQTVHEGLI
jgi:hypothetical protein